MGNLLALRVHMRVIAFALVLSTISWIIGHYPISRAWPQVVPQGNTPDCITLFGDNEPTVPELNQPEWVEYTSEELGYSVAYPENFVVFSAPVSGSAISIMSYQPNVDDTHTGLPKGEFKIGMFLSGYLHENETLFEYARMRNFGAGLYLDIESVNQCLISDEQALFVPSADLFWVQADSRIFVISIYDSPRDRVQEIMSTIGFSTNTLTADSVINRRVYPPFSSDYQLPSSPQNSCEDETCYTGWEDPNRPTPPAIPNLTEPYSGAYPEATPHVTCSYGCTCHTDTFWNEYFARDYASGESFLVLAAADGTLTRHDEGIAIVAFINHGSGIQTKYAHLDKVEVRGQTILDGQSTSVSRGETIGWSGDTGASAIHLHFEVRDGASTTFTSCSNYAYPFEFSGVAPTPTPIPTCCGCLPTSCCGSAAATGSSAPAFMLYDDYANTQESVPISTPQAMSVGTGADFALPTTSTPEPTPTSTPTPPPTATPNPDIHPPTTSNDVNSGSHAVAVWSSNAKVHLRWSPAIDLEGSLAGYSIAWNQIPMFEPAAEVELHTAITEATSPALTSGIWYAHLQALDQAGNVSETVHLGPFLIDTEPPTFTTGIENRLLWSNQPQPPAFSWQAANDEGELAGYRLYWGNDPNGIGEEITTATTYTPTEVPKPGQSTTRYLRVAAEDAAGNQSAWQTVASWHYDPVAPTGSLDVAYGSPTVRTLNVTLNIDARDEGGSVNQMRFSHDGSNWSSWEPYARTMQWQLRNTDELQTIYAQVQDEAGNISETMAATVRVELNVELPASSSYSIARSTFGMGGGDKSSPSYQVRGTSGQAHQTSHMQSVSYRVNSGYWAGSVCPTVEFEASPAISTDGSNVTLNWTAVTGATSYNIYRDTTPFFDPTTSYDSTVETNWEDAGAAGDPATNYYYIVKPVNDCGVSSAIYRLGAFDYGLTPGQ